MSQHHVEALKGLHTALIDSRNGYDEALKDAEGKGLTPLFQEMIALRTQHATELSALLSGLGEKVDEKGSFMSTVHRAVISVRALFTELDESILPGLIDGEKRILSYYDDAITASPPASKEQLLLSQQRSTLSSRIADMEVRKAKAA